MPYTMGEIREELQTLGYGTIPEDFIVSSMSQLQLDTPQAWDNTENGDKGGGSSSARRALGAGKLLRHGSPVPGDREFADNMTSGVCGWKELGSPAVRCRGRDSVCLAPDFATQLDEIRKMLTIMQSTKEELFGSSNTQSTGLEDEHKLYVGNLLDQWRVVGRTIRSKGKECAAVGVGVLPTDINIGSASNSETGTRDQLEQDHGSSINSEEIRKNRQKQHEAFVESEIQPPPDEPSTSGRGSETWDDECDLHVGSDTLAESNNELNRSIEDRSLIGEVETEHHQEEGNSTGVPTETDLNEVDSEEKCTPTGGITESDLNEGDCQEEGTFTGGITETDLNEEAFHEEGTCTGGITGTDLNDGDSQEEGTFTGVITGTDLNEGDSHEEDTFTGSIAGTDLNEGDSQEGTFTGSIAETDLNEGDSHMVDGRGEKEGNETGPVFTRQESSSDISPGVSYQQGGMLYPENFTLDAYNEQPDLPSSNDEIPPESHQGAEVEDHPSSPSPRSLSTQAPEEVPDKPSEVSEDQFLAAFQKSLDDLDPQDIIDRETFANVNQKASDTTQVRCGDTPAQQPVVESENPRELDVAPVLMGTPDRMGDNVSPQSPLSDRSNMRTAEKEDPEVLAPTRTNLTKKTESNSPAALKRTSTVTLKRSRSSRVGPRRNEIGEEADDAHLSDVGDGGSQGDSHLVSENTTPPPRARKLKTERVSRHSLLDKSVSSSVTIRNKGVDDHSDLDISSLGLSPIRVREQPTSPVNHSLSNRERPCGGNWYAEHRLGSHCSACHPPPPPTHTPLRKSTDSNSQTSTTGSKSPLGRSNPEAGLSESEASPQQKRSPVKKEVGGGLLPKQKVPLKKSPAAPSGIYSPLIDANKNDLTSNSKVLKPRRLTSSMDFTSESSRLTDRRVPSLRPSTESSRSFGPQRATSSHSQISKTNSGSSPYSKISSLSSRIQTPKDTLSSLSSKDTLTPGGPRRGGKVDRVARFAEMQNLWKNDKFLKTSSKRKPQSFHRIFARLHLSHEQCTAAIRERVLEEMRPTSEQPPFVVPPLYSSSEVVCTF